MIPRVIRDIPIIRGNRGKVIYNFLARRFRDASHWRFMNYGYAAQERALDLDLHAEDEAERYSAQLYHFVASQTSIQDMDVLDIGSGRGGGTSHIHRYLGPRSTTGMDLAEDAVAFCNALYSGIDGLRYVAGDAMNLPFEDGSFDAVTNIESAHCYPDRDRFVTEVMRVLRPGGHFLMTDFSAVESRHDPRLEEAGFEIRAETDITCNVLRAMELDTQRREGLIASSAPRIFRRIFVIWAGTENSWIYRDFDDGRRSYIVYHAVKPS